MTSIQFNVPVNPSIEPRWYQNGATWAVTDCLARNPDAHPIVALPTGSGKSLVQSMIIAYYLGNWPRLRIMCLTHVKELIAQNVADLLEFWPSAPVGIFSAGLSEKIAHTPIVFGGAQSVVNDIARFGWRDIIFIDECHLTNSKDESVYGKIIAGLRKINPRLKIVGLTATKYRMGQGLLTEGNIFTEVIYDMTTMEMFNLLIAQGYLSPLITKPTDSHFKVEPISVDASTLRMAGDDFKQNEVEALMMPVTRAACAETVAWGQDRQCWLTFASGVEHAKKINVEYKRYGINSLEIYGELGDKERDRRIALYKANQLRSAVVFNIGTVGFNHKPIDLISFQRASGSTVWWIQAGGRGTRPSPVTNKENCLGLDFGNNVARLGPINDPLIPRKRGTRSTPGVVPIKICPMCGFYNHTRAVVCCNAPICTYVFPQHTHLQETASIEQLLRMDEQKIETFDVKYVLYARGKFAHTKPYLGVSYHCGNAGYTHFLERIWIENDGESRGHAIGWWRKRYRGEQVLARAESYVNWVPSTVEDALRVSQNLRQPRIIRVDTASKEPKIVSCEF